MLRELLLLELAGSQFICKLVNAPIVLLELVLILKQKLLVLFEVHHLLSQSLDFLLEADFSLVCTTQDFLLFQEVVFEGGQLTSQRIQTKGEFLLSLLTLLCQLLELEPEAGFQLLRCLSSFLESSLSLFGLILQRIHLTEQLLLTQQSLFKLLLLSRQDLQGCRIFALLRLLDFL